MKSDRESVLTAAEQFLTKSDQEREGLIRLVMEGHLRGIIGQLTVERDLYEGLPVKGLHQGVSVFAEWFGSLCRWAEHGRGRSSVV